MNIIDTNGVDYVLGNNITLNDDYLLVPDVAEEVEMTQLIHGRRMPRRITEFARHALFEEAIYLQHYNDVLNRYGGRSFYNMTGFGDVSVIATLRMLVDVFEAQKAARLFDPTEQIIIYTNDAGLAAKIANEFNGRDIHVRPINNIQ